MISLIGRGNPMSMKRLSRRSALKAMGVLIPLPLLEATLPRMARGAAEAAGVPPRMLVCHFGTGMNIREFFPQETGSECSLPRIVKPLEAWRKRMTILSGLQLEHGGGHTGDYTFLTGAEGWKSTGIKSGISADQIVAREIGNETRFASLQLSIARGTNYGQQGLATLSWNANGIPLAAENDPHVLFQRLFAAEDADEASRRDANFRRRGSILDYVHDQAKQMKPRISATDGQKLDEYFTSVREIENQLRRDIEWSQRPKAKPSLDGLGDYSRSLTPNTPGFDYTTYQKLMYDLIALAFQTDSTRVITYNVRQELAGGTFPVHNVSKNFHALTHHNNDPKSLEELAQVDEINMGFWARFLERLNQIPQPDGRSLLDHTLIAYSSSAGMDHSRDKLPTAVFGGEALGVTHHTHLRLLEATPLARVWHTMADRMGVHRPTLQDSPGPVTELLRS
jgi:hypothetical protein